VGSVLDVWKLLECIHCSTLVSYCAVGRITSEFPLSAQAIMAALSLSFSFMLQMILSSAGVLCVCVCCSLVIC
jgi:hypothetical protein